MSIFKAAGVLGVSVVVAVTIAHTAASDELGRNDVSWPQRGAILDQGPSNACTGFAVAGLLGGTKADALRIYQKATEIDPFPGAYPTKDTGSTGPDAMEAAKRLGYFHGFKTVTSADRALGALKGRPLVVSLAWPVKGVNHELVLLGRHGDTLVLKNSWGTGFGNHGLLYLPVPTFKKIFNDGEYVSAS